MLTTECSVAQSISRNRHSDAEVSWTAWSLLVFLGDQIQNRMIIVREHTKPKYQWRSSNKKLDDPHSEAI